MQELCKKILALPELTLTQAEYDTFIDIVNSLEDKNVTLLQQALVRKDSVDAPISTAHHPQIIDYMSQWRAILDELLYLNKLFNITWKKYNNDLITNDDLLPLTIELLPRHFILALDNPDLILQKTDQAAQLAGIDKLAFVFYNFYAAVSILIKESTLPEEEQPNCSEKIISAASKIRLQLMAEKHIKLIEEDNVRENRIFNLKLVCEKLQSNVLIAFKEKLKDKEKVTYKYYFSNSHIKEDIQLSNNFIEKNIDEIRGKILALKEPQEFLLLLDKYLVLKDMHYSLINPRYTSSNKLMEFTAKYNYFKTLLFYDESDEIIDKLLATAKLATNYLGLNRFISWKKTANEKSHEMICLFMQQEDDEKCALKIHTPLSIKM